MHQLLSWLQGIECLCCDNTSFSPAYETTCYYVAILRSCDYWNISMTTSFSGCWRLENVGLLWVTQRVFGSLAKWKMRCDAKMGSGLWISFRTQKNKEGKTKSFTRALLCLLRILFSPFMRNHCVRWPLWQPLIGRLCHASSGPGPSCSRVQLCQ